MGILFDGLWTMKLVSILGRPSSEWKFVLSDYAPIVAVTKITHWYLEDLYLHIIKSDQIKKLMWTWSLNENSRWIGWLVWPDTGSFSNTKNIYTNLILLFQSPTFISIEYYIKNDCTILIFVDHDIWTLVFGLSLIYYQVLFCSMFLISNLFIVDSQS